MRALLLVALIAVSPGLAEAFTSAASAKRVLSFDPYGWKYIDFDHRKALAVAIKDYWDGFDAKLPRLSPENLKWLKGELNSTDPSRITNAGNSKQFALQQLGQIVDECKGDVSQLIKAQDDPRERSTEMYDWVKVADCYHVSEGNVAWFLKQAGLDQTSGSNDGVTFDNLIVTELLNGVIPSAMADTMGWPPKRK